MAFGFSIEIPEAERHLRTHPGLHLHRRGPGAPRAGLAQLAEKGVTEIAYQPKGPDVARELTAFAAMADLRGR